METYERLVCKEDDDGNLFRLAAKTALLTAITFGLYRFWARTRIRRYLWSTIRLDGDSLEYTGTGLEKFLGFLVAVVVLAIYLGLVQIVLFFFGVHFVFRPNAGGGWIMQSGVFYLSVLAVMPLATFARYRALRYKLARTRFRGIRFGLGGSAWSYVWRVMAHSGLTILTLGILLPRQTFLLEKFRTDHAWYGDRRFVQGGRWQALYPAAIHLFIGCGIVIAGGGLLAIRASEALALLMIALGALWAGVGYFYYRVHAFRYLTAEKRLEGDILLGADTRLGPIAWAAIKGYFLVSLLAGVFFGIAAAVVGVVAATANGLGAANLILVLPIAAAYLGAFGLLGAATLALVRMPIIECLAGSVCVGGTARLADIRQRGNDDGADAGGFADALDVGGAI